MLKMRAFQRLRHVKQLGFSEAVVPGATHSHLIHSLGVFNTARQLTTVVNKGDTGFDSITAEAATAAAMVHDIDHAPFSRAFETAFAMAGIGVGHEDRSVCIIRGTPVRDTLEAMPPNFPNRVARTRIGRTFTAPSYRASLTRIGRTIGTYSALLKSRC